MSKFIVLALIVIVLIGGFIWFNSNRNLPAISPTPNNSVQMSSVPIYQSDKFYNIKAEYPQFKDASADFNKKISDLIEGEIEAFKADSRDNWDARKATALPGENLGDNPATPYDFLASWTPTQFSSKYLSFVINLYYFTGGAHGNEEVYAFNYDFAKQKEITLGEFLGYSQPAFRKLAELSTKDLASQLQTNGEDPANDPMLAEGTKPTEENFQNFNFTYNSLIIYFQKYQVAPGVDGIMKSTFFKDVLGQNSIKSDYWQ